MFLEIRIFIKYFAKKYSSLVSPMSAKDFDHKPPFHLPEFPPEIWFTILRQATWDYEFPFSLELTFESIGTPLSEYLLSSCKTLVSSYILLSVNTYLHR